MEGTFFTEKPIGSSGTLGMFTVDEKSRLVLDRVKSVKSHSQETIGLLDWLRFFFKRQSSPLVGILIADYS